MKQSSIVEELEQEGSELCLRAARVIKKLRREKQVAQHRATNSLLRQQQQLHEINTGGDYE